MKKVKQTHLKSLLRLCKEVKHKPTKKEINICSYTPSDNAYRRHFGSVQNAISLIRPEWIAYGKQYSNNYLIEEFYRVKKLLGSCPSFEDMKQHGNYHPCIIQARFKTWNKFLQTLGEKHIPKKPKCGRIFKSIDGHICYSKKEVMIDNILYEFGIKHKKDVRYPVDDEYNKNGIKRCDWKIGDLFIEYCGMLSHYNKQIRSAYTLRIDDKLNMCLKNGWDIVCLIPDTKENIVKDMIEDIKQS